MTCPPYNPLYMTGPCSLMTFEDMSGTDMSLALGTREKNQIPAGDIRVYNDCLIRL